MRILIGLSIVQTLLLGLVGLRLMAVDAHLDSVAQTSLDVLAATAQAEQQATRRQQTTHMNTRLAQTGDPTAAQISEIDPDTTQLRQILREELASLASAQRYATAPSPAPLPSEKTRKINTQLQQDLDYLIGTGTIGSSDMAKLQVQIAQLPDAERRKALTRLTKAMNAGEVDAIF